MVDFCRLRCNKEEEEEEEEEEEKEEEQEEEEEEEEVFFSIQSELIGDCAIQEEQDSCSIKSPPWKHVRDSSKAEIEFFFPVPA